MSEPLTYYRVGGPAFEAAKLEAAKRQQREAQQRYTQDGDDAARYRWLRENSAHVTYTLRPGESEHRCEISIAGAWIRRPSLDAAVDALRATE